MTSPFYDIVAIDSRLRSEAHSTDTYIEGVSLLEGAGKRDFMHPRFPVSHHGLLLKSCLPGSNLIFGKFKKITRKQVWYPELVRWELILACSSVREFFLAHGGEGDSKALEIIERELGRGHTV